MRRGAPRKRGAPLLVYGLVRAQKQRKLFPQRAKGEGACLKARKKNPVREMRTGKKLRFVRAAGGAKRKKIPSAKAGGKETPPRKGGRGRKAQKNPVRKGGRERDQTGRILKMCFEKIMQMRSRIQTIFQPNRMRRIAATILPSIRRVINPQTREVTGMIARIRLTM